MPSFWHYFKNTNHLTFSHIFAGVQASFFPLQQSNGVDRTVAALVLQSQWFVRKHKNVGIVSGGRCSGFFLQSGELLRRTGFWCHRSADAFFQYNSLLGV